jgi:hypothetical protein
MVDDALLARTGGDWLAWASGGAVLRVADAIDRMGAAVRENDVARWKTEFLGATGLATPSGWSTAAWPTDTPYGIPQRMWVASNVPSRGSPGRSRRGSSTSPKHIVLRWQGSRATGYMILYSYFFGCPS